MTHEEKNKLRCKLHYQKTKGNLTDDQKERRREINRIAQAKYYENNKSTCILRVCSSRLKKREEKLNSQKNKIKEAFEKLSQTISINEINFIKKHKTLELIKKHPRLKMWNININQWTFKDYNVFKELVSNL